MIFGTGFITMILGALSAAIPKAFDFADKKMTFQQELAIRKMEADSREKEQAFALQAQTVQAQAKMEESYFGAVAQVDENARKYADEVFGQLVKPTGFQFLDMLNAAIRPFTTIVMLGLFVVALVSWMYGVGTINDEFGKAMGLLFGTCVEGILFFVWGAREVKQPGSTLKLLGLK